MSLYSIGKNEIRSLRNKEERLVSELKSLGGARGVSSDVKSIQEIVIENEVSKIRTKIAVLSFGTVPDDDGVA
ncbi:MAG: hypothetical protein LBJ42_01970 [Holosporales bacterium]|nr:hypothetical protein [Holosporales bacterium]